MPALLTTADARNAAPAKPTAVTAAPAPAHAPPAPSAPAETGARIFARESCVAYRFVAVRAAALPPGARACEMVVCCSRLRLAPAGFEACLAAARRCAGGDSVCVSPRATWAEVLRALLPLSLAQCVCSVRPVSLDPARPLAGAATLAADVEGLFAAVGDDEAHVVVHARVTPTFAWAQQPALRTPSPQRLPSRAGAARDPSPPPAPQRPQRPRRSPSPAASGDSQPAREEVRRRLVAAFNAAAAEEDGEAARPQEASGMTSLEEQAAAWYERYDALREGGLEGLTPSDVIALLNSALEEARGEAGAAGGAARGTWTVSLLEHRAAMLCEAATHALRAAGRAPETAVECAGALRCALASALSVTRVLNGLLEAMEARALARPPAAAAAPRLLTVTLMGLRLRTLRHVALALTLCRGRWAAPPSRDGARVNRRYVQVEAAVSAERLAEALAWLRARAPHAVTAALRPTLLLAVVSLCEVVRALPCSSYTRVELARAALSLCAAGAAAPGERAWRPRCVREVLECLRAECGDDQAAALDALLRHYDRGGDTCATPQQQADAAPALSLPPYVGLTITCVRSVAAADQLYLRSRHAFAELEDFLHPPEDNAA